MKAIIWIIILAVVAWGIWYFMADENVVPTSYGNNAGQVEGASDMYNPDGSLKVGGEAEVEVEVKG